VQLRPSPRRQSSLWQACELWLGAGAPRSSRAQTAPENPVVRAPRPPYRP
jgi:hypothetical protein